MKNTACKKEETNRVDEIIKEWKKRKAQDIAEAREAFHTPAYQKMLKQLQKENAAKGITIKK